MTTYILDKLLILRLQNRLDGRIVMQGRSENTSEPPDRLTDERWEDSAVCCQESEDISELGIGERHDQTGWHEGHFDLGAADDVGFGKGALFAGDVAEDLAAGGAEEDAGELGAVLELH